MARTFAFATLLAAGPGCSDSESGAMWAPRERRQSERDASRAAHDASENEPSHVPGNDPDDDPDDHSDNEDDENVDAAAPQEGSTVMGGSRASDPPPNDLPQVGWPPVLSPTSFHDNGDGTVTDERSHLIWQQDVEDFTYPWADAGPFCASLTLADAQWRLPTAIELQSIIDFTRTLPAIDSSVFPKTPGNSYWTSTVSPNCDCAWEVSFGIGSSDPNSMSLQNHVRCVRASVTPVDPSSRRFQDHHDGTVTELGTGLTWQQAAPNEPAAEGCSLASCTQDGAKAYCAGLALAGGGWRLPEIYELLTLLDSRRVNPPIDLTAFPGSTKDDFWTATALADDPSAKAWAVAFFVGNTHVDDPGDPKRVRCVR